MSTPHGASCSSPSGADTPRSSADPSLREPSGLSLHTIKRATQGAPEMGACARPARSLPRSRRGRDTGVTPPPRHECRKVEQNPSLALPCPQGSHHHHPHAHTNAGHADGAAHFSLLLGIRQTHKGLPRASFPEEADPWDHVGPGSPSRPKTGGESGQGPVVKVRRATAAKSPGQKQ